MRNVFHVRCQLRFELSKAIFPTLQWSVRESLLGGYFEILLKRSLVLEKGPNIILGIKDERLLRCLTTSMMIPALSESRMPRNNRPKKCGHDLLPDLAAGLHICSSGHRILIVLPARSNKLSWAASQYSTLDLSHSIICEVLISDGA